ncbi:hypothetical protein D3C75_438860 [compost metagenome]
MSFSPKNPGFASRISPEQVESNLDPSAAEGLQPPDQMGFPDIYTHHKPYVGPVPA